MTATTKITKQDDEYRVRLFIDGEYQAGADYFADYKDDAIETAAEMVDKAEISDKTTANARDEQDEFDKAGKDDVVEFKCPLYPESESCDGCHDDDCGSDGHTWPAYKLIYSEQAS